MFRKFNIGFVVLKLTRNRKVFGDSMDYLYAPLQLEGVEKT